MKTLAAEDAKYGFDRLIDPARAALVVVAKRGRPVVAVMALEESEHLTILGTPTLDQAAEKASI